MRQHVRIWNVVAHDQLKALEGTRLDLESRLESWIAADVAMVDEQLLVIGRQVETDFGGVVDLLCIDPKGDLVILELKRDKTPRDITAQALDYASWVVSLSHERVTEIAEKYLGGTLEESFASQFRIDLPESLNGDHRMLIIASRIDQSSERIIQYLSDRHGVSINAITFQFFKDESGQEILTRVFLLEPDEVEYRARTKGTSKRKPTLTYEQLEELAEEHGVGELYRSTVLLLGPHFDGTRTTRSSIAFVGPWNDGRAVMLSLIPPESSSEHGLAFQVYSLRLCHRFGVDQNRLTAALPPTEDWEYYSDAPNEWSGLRGHFSTIGQVKTLERGLTDATG